MKTLIALILLCFFIPISHAETFTTTLGEQITGQVKRVEPDGIIVSTQYGITKVKFKNLPVEVCQKYGYDPKQAEAFQESIKAQAVQSQQEIAKKKAKELEAMELAKKKAALLNQQAIEAKENAEAEALAKAEKLKRLEELHLLVVKVEQNGVLADKMEPHENDTVRRMKATHDPVLSGMVPAGVSRAGLAAAMQPDWKTSGTLIFLKGEFPGIAEGDRKVVKASRNGSHKITSQNGGEEKTVALYEM